MTRRLAVVFLIGLGVRLILAWLPIDMLISRTLPDDAFIYFVISRNIATGLGATFDGLHPTNGFHPLWALLTVPIFWLSKGGDLPVHLALSLGAICDALAGGLTALLINRLIPNRFAGEWTLALYLFNPRVIQESVNGLETSLGMLALAVCLAAWFWVLVQPAHKGRAVVFGLTLGITVLARSDLAIIVGLMGLVYAFQSRRALAAPSLAALVALLTVAPWFVWSQIRVGTWVQSSGVAIPSLIAARIQSAPNSAFLWDSLLWPVINFSLRDVVIYPGVALLAAIVGLLLARWPNRSAVGTARPSINLNAGLWVPLVGALLIVGVHTFIRWYPRGWYFVPLAWAWALLAGPLLAAGLATQYGRRYSLIIAVALGLIIVAQSIKMIGEPEYRSQSDMRAGATWLAENVAPGETVGAFNAGIYAYFSERRVLNLDGLVDWGAITARQQKRLLDYFVEQGGSLIIDHKAYVESFSDFFGTQHLEPVETLPVVDLTYGPIQIYRVSP
jgi:hypothetical protein